MVLNQFCAQKKIEYLSRIAGGLCVVLTGLILGWQLPGDGPIATVSAEGGLIAHWAFDEGSGMYVMDSAGAASMECGGNTSWTYESGTNNPILVLNFIGSNCNAYAVGGISSYSDITIAAWVKGEMPSNGDEYILLRESNNPTTDTYYLKLTGYNGDTGVTGGFSGALGSASASSTFSSSLLESQWNHFVIVIQSGVRVSLYINGAPMAYNPTTSQMVMGEMSSIFLGGSPSGKNLHDATLDDVRIYSHAMEDAEVAYLYKGVDGPGGGGEVNCMDNSDDDADGTTDCFDADCVGSSYCDSCVYGVLCDTKSYCQSMNGDCGTYCGGTTVNCCCTFTAVDEVCNNLFDDDLDGKIDCSDSDCPADAFCTPGTELCDNGKDDDEDGKTDCADSDCGGSTCHVNGTCTNGLCCNGLNSEQACNDLIDDDCDGSIDCADIDCAGDATCAIEGGLIAHWQFDEGSGTSTKDGTDNTVANLSPTQSTFRWSTDTPQGVINGKASAEFNGSYFLAIPASPKFSIGKEISLAFWIKPSGTQTSNQSILYRLATTGQYKCVRNTGSIECSVYTRSTSFRVSGNLAINQWQHVAFTAKEYGSANLYINGKLVRTEPMNDYFDPSSLNYTYIGSEPDGNSPLTGKLDDVRVYSQALSASEIQALADSVPSEICSDTLDNDSDGNIDCADSDCASEASCTSRGSSRILKPSVWNTKASKTLEFSTIEGNTNLNTSKINLSGFSLSSGTIEKGSAGNTVPGFTHQASLNNQGMTVGFLKTDQKGGYVQCHAKSFGMWFSTPDEYDIFRVKYDDGTTEEFTANPNGWYYGTDPKAPLDQRSTDLFAFCGWPGELCPFRKGWFMGIDAPTGKTITSVHPFRNTVSNAFEVTNFSYVPADDCGAPPVEVCSNAKDDDGDGKIDCADSDCSADHACKITDSCNGLLGYWPFDDERGTIATDKTGKGNPGQLREGAKWTSDTPTSQLAGNTSAIAFQTAGYVDAQGYPTISDKLTVSFWMKPKTTGRQTILSNHRQGTGRPSGFVFFIDPNAPESITYQLRTDGTCCDTIASNGIVKANEWQHIAGTYDGEQMHLYINGVEDANSPLSANGNIAGDQRIWIGNNVDAGSIGHIWGDYIGALDDVRVYSRALTAQDITDLASGKQLCTPDPPPTSVCGNARLESPETCDDGNTTSGDGCSAFCIYENSFRNSEAVKIFHMSPIYCNAASCPTQLAELNGKGGIENCTLMPEYGTLSKTYAFSVPNDTCSMVISGYVDNDVTMYLDGAAQSFYTYAYNSCNVNPSYGFTVPDRKIDKGSHMLNVKFVDRGVATAAGLTVKLRCDIVDPPPTNICGNAKLESPETCDDGNTKSGDGCSRDCKKEVSVCGNNFLEAVEECDDGNIVSGDRCSSACKLEVDPVCGDGKKEGVETCDDGNRINTDACTNACVPALCGDGIIFAGTEECDDGNSRPGDGCASCRNEGICGDAECSASLGETCKTCTRDCGICPASCGDGSCRAPENSESCPLDCPPPPPSNVCGDGECSGAENCGNCIADCSAMCPPPDVPPPPGCGNGTCAGDELCFTCPQDCGACLPFCGDGACQQDSESCTDCPLDCGICQSVCGDNLCVSPEDCSNCTEDCGSCTPFSEQQAEAIVHVERCGDFLCNAITESCTACPIDCGDCPAPIPVTTAEREKAQTQAVIALDSIAQRNEQYLDAVQGKLTSLVEAAKAGTLDLQSARVRSDLASVSSQIAKAQAQVQRDLSEDVGALFSENLSLSTVASALPPETLATIDAAAGKGDLEGIRAALPSPILSHDEALAAVEEYAKFMALVSPSAEDEDSEKIAFLPTARAQETGESGGPAVSEAPPKQPMTAKGAFKSVNDFIDVAKENAVDPVSANVTLDEQIAYLQNRSRALAQLVGEDMPRGELNRDLQQVEAEMNTTESRKLFSLVGIVDYILSTENFRRLDEKMDLSLMRMRTGLQRFRVLFAWEVSPRAEAANVLTGVSRWKEEDLDRFFADNLGEKKDLITKLTGTAEEQKLLSALPEAERKTFTDRFAEWEISLKRAESTQEIVDSVLERQTILTDLETAVRGKRNIFFRMVYAVQDFFGIGS